MDEDFDTTSDLYEYCAVCGDDITLAMGVEDGVCRDCQEEE